MGRIGRATGRSARRGWAALAATTTLLIGVLGAGVQPGGAAVLEVSNVGASMTAPADASGAFGITATITNTGTLPQLAGATVTISAAGGAITAAPGCDLSAGSAVCTTSQTMTPGSSRTYAATVTPDAGSASVVTQVVTKANQADVNAPGSPADDTATGTTTIVYVLDLDLTNDPSTVQPGNDTLLDAAVTNNGAAQTGVSLILNSGGVIDTRLPVPAGCTIDAIDQGKLSCAGIVIGLGETVHIVAAVITPTSGANSMQSSAAVTGQHGSGDSDTVHTALDTNANGAFVPPGAGVCKSESHESTCFSVPSTWDGGTVVHLNQQHLPGTMCGTQLCSPYIAEALWPKSDNPAHNDPNNPLTLHIQYNTKQNCNGSGWGKGCHQLYWMNDAADTAKPMPQCSTYRVNQRIPAVMSDPHEPCLNFIQRDQQGIVTYEVAILIDTLIPKISG